MPNIIEGNLYAKSADKFCIVVSRFNEFISSKLLAGALEPQPPETLCKRLPAGLRRDLGKEPGEVGAEL